MNILDIEQKKNILIVSEYDGTKFHGWQSQNNLITIQDTIQKAIYEISGEKVKLYGCSRTDAGVHARGHVANFFLDTKIPQDKLMLAINSKLPSAIAIKEARFVDSDFNARFCAIGKRYSYTIYNSQSRPVLERFTSHHVPKKLDIEKMNDAAKLFVGEHDFSAFMATGSEIKNTIRKINSIKINANLPIIKIQIEGNGFLYNMVRIIAGTLMYVGLGKIPQDSISDIIKNKDRKLAGKTLPANGLCLEKVFYDNLILEENGD